MQNDLGRKDARYLRADGALVDLQERKIWSGTEETQVTAKTFDLIVIMMTRAQELVTKEELFETLWGGKAVSDSVLTTAVKDARRALGDSARSPDFLATVHGHGYRFLKPVDLVDSLDNPSADKPDASASPTGTNATVDKMTGTNHQTAASDTEVSNTSIANQPKKLWIGLIGAAAFAAMLIIIGMSGKWGAEDDTSFVENQSPMQSIAVLPFDDFSKSQDQQWFGDGLAEEILNTLAAHDDLLVASRRSAFEYRDAGSDIREIAQNLGVSHILEGSIRDSGGKIRITAQLIRASDGFHVWSETYDRDVNAVDLFAVQEEVSRSISAKLKLAVLGTLSESNIAQTASTEAYRAFQRAMELMRRRDANSVAAAIDNFEVAIALDPTFGTAHAGLAEALIYSVMYTGSRENLEQLRPKVSDSIDRALALSPNSSDPYRAASFHALANQRYAEALDYANAALEKNPNDVDAYQRRGIIFINTNRPSDALRDFYSALQREPLSPILMSNITQLESATGNTAAALKMAKQNVELNPNSFLADLGMAEVHRDVGDYVTAHQFYTQALEKNEFAEPVIRAITELEWRLGYFTKDDRPDIGKSWTAAGVHFLSIGDKEEALAIARDHEQFAISGVSSRMLYYWSGRDQDAYRLAKPYAERFDLTGSKNYVGVNLRYIISLISIFERAGDERTGKMRARFTELIANKTPIELTHPQDQLNAAMWFMLNGDIQESYQWIDAMLDKGIVPREITLDPVFDIVRKDDAFKTRVLTMEEIAATHRATIGKRRL